MDSIQILASNLSQVTVASWTMTVPSSAGRGSAAGLLGAWRAAGGVLAGQSCCFHMVLPLTTPALLVPTSHALSYLSAP